MKERIIILEDEFLISEDLRTMLEMEGYDVVAIETSGQETIRKAEKLKPDIVLIDIQLEGEIDGVEVADFLTKKMFLPIIYITAFSDENMLERVRFTEPYGYILKPYDRKNVLITIKNALYKHKIEQKLRISKQKYRSLFEESNDPIFIHDLDGNIINANSKACELLKYEREQLLQMNTIDLFFDKILETENSYLERINKNGFTRFESIFKSSDGDLYNVDINSRVFGLEKTLIQAIVRDITSIKKIESELKRSHEELYNLRIYSDKKLEKEKRRIAREIHDELGQILTAMELELSWVRKNSDRHDKSVSDRIDSISKLIDMGLSMIRKIATELRPGVLDDLGFVAAIKWGIGEFHQKTGIECGLILDPQEFDLSNNISISMYRIFQEIMTNIIRHAKADRVKIFIWKDINEMNMEISDNGLGIPAEKIDNVFSFGLIGMRERVENLNGSFQIKGSKKKGTQITVRIPINPFDKEVQ